MARLRFEANESSVVYSILFIICAPFTNIDVKWTSYVYEKTIQFALQGMTSKSRAAASVKPYIHTYKIRLAATGVRLYRMFVQIKKIATA